MSLNLARLPRSRRSEHLFGACTLLSTWRQQQVSAHAECAHILAVDQAHTFNAGVVVVSAFMACMTAAWDGFVALGWRMLDAFAGLDCRALIGVCMLRSLEYGPRALLCVSLGEVVYRCCSAWVLLMETTPMPSVVKKHLDLGCESVLRSYDVALFVSTANAIGTLLLTYRTSALVLLICTTRILAVCI